MSVPIEPLHAISAAWANALWRASWQGGLAILAVWAICRLVPRLPASACCWLWRLALAKLLLAALWTAPVSLPLLPTAGPGAQAAPATVAGATLGQTPPLAGIWGLGDAVGRDPLTSLRPSVLVALLILWLAGAGWCAARTLHQLAKARRLRRSCAPPRDQHLVALVDELCPRLGLRRAPAVRETGHSQGALVLGALSPDIVLPSGLLAACTSDELRLLLAYELAHVRRRDLWWGWLLAAAQNAFFFHPLVWLARREWQLAQEMACDALALSATGAPPAEYGTMLVRAAEQQAAPLELATVGVAASHRMLRERLVAMRSRMGSAPRWLVAASLLLLVPGLFVLAPRRSAARNSALARAEGGTETPGLARGTPRSGAPTQSGAIVARGARRVALHGGAALATAALAARDPDTIGVPTGRVVYEVSGSVRYTTTVSWIEHGRRLRQDMKSTDAAEEQQEDLDGWSIFDGSTFTSWHAAKPNTLTRTRMPECLIAGKPFPGFATTWFGLTSSQARPVGEGSVLGRHCEIWEYRGEDPMPYPGRQAQPSVRIPREVREAVVGDSDAPRQAVPTMRVWYWHGILLRAEALTTAPSPTGAPQHNSVIATRIEASPALSPSLFEVPQGYEVRDRDPYAPAQSAPDPGMQGGMRGPAPATPGVQAGGIAPPGFKPGAPGGIPGGMRDSMPRVGAGVRAGGAQPPGAVPGVPGGIAGGPSPGKP